MIYSYPELRNLSLYLLAKGEIKSVFNPLYQRKSAPASRRQVLFFQTYINNNMETKEKPSCLCGTSEYNVVSCSGASDLGHLSDLVARRLRDNKVRK